MTSKREPKPCDCGCGDWTRGGRFLPGHDAKYHSVQRKLAIAAGELVGYFESQGDAVKWLSYGARRFYDYTGPVEVMAMAKHILTHPRSQATEYNRRNGWTPYTTPSEFWHRTLHAAS